MLKLLKQMQSNELHELCFFLLANITMHSAAKINALWTVSAREAPQREGKARIHVRRVREGPSAASA
jgi:hypothetical protein